MDVHAGGRGASGPITQRKSYTVAFKDAATARDENVRFCNRIGCSGRIKYNQTTNFGTLDRSNYSRPSSCSSHGNGVVGTSSKRNSVMMSAKKFNLDSRRKLFSQRESSVSGDSLGRSSTYESKLGINYSEKITVTESGSPNVSSNVRPHKPNTQPSSSKFSASRIIGSGPSKSSTLSRYSPRILKSGSKPVVVPPSSSVSKSITKNAMKKISHEMETSSSRSGRKTMALSSSRKHVSPLTSGTSISNSRRNSCIVGGDSCATMSVRTRNSGNTNKRMRSTNQQNRQNFSSIGGPADTETPNNALSIDLSSYSVSNSNGDVSSTLMYFSSEDLGFNHLRNRHALPRDNLDVSLSHNLTSQVLLALERIEHSVLTHEQVLALEASFFQTGINLLDQHLDMRMDIDNMSYEELLALEERMGMVSTALSEEALSKCIRRSMYPETSLEVQEMGSREDGGDIKCSICQEEFGQGDEVGTLIECCHGYHITCITQWLRLKNWCPICKGLAAPSHPISSL